MLGNRCAEIHLLTAKNSKETNNNKQLFYQLHRRVLCLCVSGKSCTVCACSFRSVSGCVSASGWVIALSEWLRRALRGCLAGSVVLNVSGSPCSQRWRLRTEPPSHKKKCSGELSVLQWLHLLSGYISTERQHFFCFLFLYFLTVVGTQHTTPPPVVYSAAHWYHCTTSPSGSML